ncbi:MAG: adenylate/guanylate cyclase domain-containing protein [Pseudomonadota bacterium]
MSDNRFLLRTILFADLVGYTRAVRERESSTLDFMQHVFAIFRKEVTGSGGEFVKTTGDGFMASFESASRALDFAMQLHRLVENVANPFPAPPQFRVGLHVGEVERAGPDLYGHAVNVAARLEGEARSGGVCVSQDVYQIVRHRTQFRFISGGVVPLKNIPDSIPLYHVIEADELDERSGAAQVAIELLNGPVTRDESGRHSAPRPLSARAVLGFLSLAPDHATTTDRLQALIWPEHADEAARRSLIRSFRAVEQSITQLASGVLQRDGDRVLLAAERVQTDLVTARTNLKSGKVASFLSDQPDWPEAILRGLDRCSRPFKAWVAVERHLWRDRMAQALQDCLNRADPEEPLMLEAARALLVLEPSHEVAVRSLMAHYDATGNRALALKTYSAHEKMMQERYAAEPSHKTSALAEQIRHQTIPAPGNAPAALSAATPERPAILVPEFEAPNVRGMEQHLVFGFRTELMNNLARFKEWTIVETESPASPAAYRFAAHSEKAHGRLSLQVSLSTSEDRRMIWSERFAIDLQDWFDRQTGLVRRIAAHAEIYISADRVCRTVASDAMTASEYEDWLRSEHLLSFWDPAMEDEAQRILEGIIERNKSFAPAYASLAGIYNVGHLIRPGSARDARTDKRAVGLGERAVEIDPLDARNHRAIAWSAAMNAQYERASIHFEMAAGLNPASPNVILSCGLGLAFAGKHDRGAALLAEALQLAPVLSPVQWGYVATTRYMIGDFEGAVQAAEVAGTSILNVPGWKAVALACLGRLEEAKLAFDEEVEAITKSWTGPDDPAAPVVRNWFLSAFPIGKRADRMQLTEALKKIS